MTGKFVYVLYCTEYLTFVHFSAHWDPFSDAITAGPEFNKSAGIIKQQIEKFWCWPAFANMAIFTRLSKNGKG